MMKVAYIGKIQLTDVDFSYIHSLRQMADVTYVLEVCPRFLSGPAFNIEHIYPKTGVFKAVDVYPEFAQYGDFIDLDKFYVANTSGKLWVLKSFWTNILVLFFLLKHKFDVIHLAWPLNIYEFCLYLLGKKMVLTVHDPIPHTGLNTKIVRFRRFIAFRSVKKLILLNSKQRQVFLDYYKINPSKVINSRLSAYTYLHSVDQDDSVLPYKSGYLLFFGKISKYKGLDYLLPAMEQVHKQCPDLKLVIAGGGKFDFDISHYQSLDYISIINRFILKEELVALIKNSAAVVCPYTDATQSGVLMSSFAFYKPAIVTNTGGLPEMLNDGAYGLIAEPRDIDSLAQCIMKMFASPSLLSSFTERIKKDYDSGSMSWNEIAQHLMKEYGEVV